jgi:peroxiredoxin
MKTLREQTDAQIQKTRTAKPEFMQSVDEALADALKFEAGRHTPEIGASAPDFELPDATGCRITRSSLLAQGPLILSFYRGSWCPYCNLELRALQNRLPEISALGAGLVAISPQMPDTSLSSSEKAELEFPVLSDLNARVAASYGVAWEVPELLLEHMRVDRNLDLAALNGGNGRILPIPATFLLNREGLVVWKFVDVDYRKRAEPSDIIEALKRLH